MNEQVSQYQAVGYCVVPGLIPAAAITAARERIDEIIETLSDSLVELEADIGPALDRSA